jgi:hypothetical protein
MQTLERTSSSKSLEDFSNSPIYDYNQDSNNNEDTIDSDYSSIIDFSVLDIILCCFFNLNLFIFRLFPRLTYRNRLLRI